MAETVQIPADAAVRFVTMATDESNDRISMRIGRNRTYLSTLFVRNRMPNISIFCEIANACGFDVVLVRGNEQVIVIPTEDDE